MYIRSLKRLLLMWAATLENKEIPLMLNNEHLEGVMPYDLSVAIMKVNELFKREKTHAGSLLAKGDNPVCPGQRRDRGAADLVFNFGQHRLN